MGYYGLGPGTKVADQLTPLEQALRSIPHANWHKTLTTLETLLKNVSQNHKEEKYRKIKLSNPRISEQITSIGGALRALLIIGWKFSMAEEAVLTLPSGTRITFPDHVNKIIDAKDFFKKEEEKERFSRGLSRVAAIASPKEFVSIFVDKRDEATKSKQSLDNVNAMAQGKYDL